MQAHAPLAQAHADNQSVDWLRLPAGCREHIVKCMDSVSRAAWRLVCMTACQDVHATTTTLTWRGCDVMLEDASPPPDDSIDAWIYPVGLAPTTSLPAGLISKVPTLQHLSCSGMPGLTSIQGVPAALRSLDLTHCDHVHSFAPLQRCTALERLSVAGELGQRVGLAPTLPPAMSAISAHLRCLTFVVYDAPWDPVAEAVVLSLAHLSRLQELTFAMQPHDMDEDEWPHWRPLARAIGRMAELRALTLDMSRCDHASGDSLFYMAPAIAGLTRLRSLRLKGGLLCEEATQLLGQALCALPEGLTRLELRGTIITDPASTAVLVPALLAHSRTLSSLTCTLRSFGDDPIGHRGITPLAPGLRCCQALTHLDLSGCGIGAEGAPALAAALFGCAPRLTSLDLSGNFMRDEGAAALAPVLSRMTALASLGYNGNDMELSGAESLAPALAAIAPTLTSLDLSRSCIRNHGMAVLAPAMRRMTALERLLCGHVDMGFAGAAVVASLLPAMTRLKHLDLSRNHIGFEGLGVLAGALQVLGGRQHWVVDLAPDLACLDQVASGTRDFQALDAIAESVSCFASLEVCLSVKQPPASDPDDPAAAEARLSGVSVTLAT